MAMMGDGVKLAGVGVAMRVTGTAEGGHTPHTVTHSCLTLVDWTGGGWM